ncbi:hypothetical protein BaRGS_00010053 [Batillaria attramentaria]|uniref:Uncharacterized protein n=1 Tax=Batillaria attramentaria TaxID=370345 RepID=A0ABD0LHI9_9CAEN
MHSTSKNTTLSPSFMSPRPFRRKATLTPCSMHNTTLRLTHGTEIRAPNASRDYQGAMALRRGDTLAWLSMVETLINRPGRAAGRQGKTISEGPGAARTGTT